MIRNDFCATIWQAMVQRYGQTVGLTEICLALQNQHGADVVLALFLDMADRAGLCPTPAEADSLEAAVAQWRHQVILPLRAVRTWQKAHGTTPAQSKHREAVKRLELEAEQIELSVLTALFATQTGGGASAALRYLTRLNADPVLVARFLAV